MAKQYGEKQKLLIIRDYILRHSDEDHPFTISELQEELERYGIIAGRKGLSRDLKVLGCQSLSDGEEDPDDDAEDLMLPPAFRLDLVRRGRNYYLLSREFTLQEVKLLVDMVQSSNFITLSKTESLISKLEQLVSIHDAKSLRRSIYVRNRVKVLNESVYINVDLVAEAINRNRMIRFSYYRYNNRKEKELQHDGAQYEVSPFALVWADQNYYLIGYSKKHREIRTYRLDRMSDITISRASRIGKEAFEKFDIGTLPTKAFHMYMGKIQSVAIRFHNSLADTVLDRFGKELILVPDGAEHFVMQTEVMVSPQFYSWIAGFGEKATILAPPGVREGMIDHLQKALGQYQ